jgi:hypothetical protein
MWEPVGPLPAAVYRRRRRVAVAATAAGVLLLLLSGVLLLAPREDPTLRATRAALTAPQQSPSPAPPSGPLQFGLPAGPGTSSPAPVAGSLPATTSEDLRPDETPRGAVPVPSPVPVPPTGPVNCTNRMIRTTAEIDSPDHRVGDRPVLRLVITNISPQPCVRDLDASRQEIVVWSGDGKRRLWSSNDCGNPGGPDLRTLVPQQPVVSAVTWAGRTTMPGCAEPRRPVPAGAYRVMTRLDNIISAPTPFLLR